MKKVLLSLFVVFTFFLTSCSLGTGLITSEGGVKINQNDEINKEILDTIKNLDDQVLDNIKSNSQDKILEIYSENFKENDNKEVLGDIEKNIKDKSFDYQGRYYCNISKIGKYNFSIETSKEEPFDINLGAISKEMFVSLIKSNSKSDDYMLALIYVKEQGEWKLNTLHCGAYSYNGMNAIDLYEKAKSLDGQGYKVAAALYLDLYNEVLRPAPFLQYKRESELNDYSKQLTEYFKNNNQFPEKLKNFKNINIYGFNVKYVNGSGIVPFIRYVTDTDLSNKDAIEKEANDINGNVISQYPGMKENFNIFIYEAYSEAPVDSNKTYKDYRTAVKQN
ncbi:hypothetical protein [Clostridium beijerinckii]|uniref:hypothetical protein n=1 Tax=Clostridium beijerinckii TaxID=1520 RepID=UPI0015712538|nr:hypothetical protein [Clostridium beijerinckii]NRT73806.1 hypothetical protein [Clostridium beijerinckii]